VLPLSLALGLIPNANCRVIVNLHTTVWNYAKQDGE
jgi:hypothetical protein